MRGFRTRKTVPRSSGIGGIGMCADGADGGSGGVATPRIAAFFFFMLGDID